MSGVVCSFESVDMWLKFGLPWVGIWYWLSGPIGMFVCARSARVSVRKRVWFGHALRDKKKLLVVVWLVVACQKKKGPIGMVELMCLRVHGA